MLLVNLQLRGLQPVLDSETQSLCLQCKMRRLDTAMEVSRTISVNQHPQWGVHNSWLLPFAISGAHESGTNCQPRPSRVLPHLVFFLRSTCSIAPLQCMLVGSAVLSGKNF